MSITWATTLTRRRFTGPAFDAAGRWSRGEYVDSPFAGTAQPAPGTTTSRLPNGQRAPDRVTIFAANGTLRGVDQHLGLGPDRVYVPTFGAWYQVDAIAAHAQASFSVQHQQVDCQRVDEADQAPGVPEEAEP